MADLILESVVPHRLYLVLKFNQSLQYNSISAEKFGFTTKDATPIEYSFKEIQLGDDYNSITRTLKLYFEDLPPSSGSYYLIIYPGPDPDNPLRTASGAVVQDQRYSITYDYENTPVEDAIEDQNFTVEDKSIKADVTFDVGSGSDGATAGFHVDGTVPEANEIFVDNSFNQGAISVAFSHRPMTSTLTPATVKVQRKRVGGSTFKWQDIPVEMALDSEEPILYLYMPSLDSTPVYYQGGHEYFESGYKYRVLLSKNIGYFKE